MGSGHEDFPEHDDPDYRPQHRYYCIQLDVVLSDVLGRPVPLSHAWTSVVIWDMIIRDVPNVCECILLGPGSAIPFFGRRLEPHNGLYLHEAQELMEEMM